jgi:hypothetical protein
MGLTAVTSFRSIKIIHVLLSSSNGSSTATKTAVKVERRLMQFSLCVTVLFLTAWSLCAIYFTLPIFGFEHPTSARGTSSPRFFDGLLFFASCTSLNPLLNLYFDPALRTLLQTFYTRRSRARRIGSSVMRTTTTASGFGSSRAARRKKQHHGGSRVSHIDKDEGGSWEEIARETDAMSRELLIDGLFGEEAAAPTEEEQRAIQLGQELVLAVDSKMEPKENSNKLVELAGYERGEGVMTLKAKVTVRAGASDIAAFLHDYDSAYYTKAAEKDLSVRDRFKIEDSEDRSHVHFEKIRVPEGRYRDRTVCTKDTCGVKNKAGGMMHVSFPAVHDSEPEEIEHVRASCIWVFRIKPVQVDGIAPGDASLRQAAARKKNVVELYTQLDFKTGNPKMEYVASGRSERKEGLLVLLQRKRASDRAKGAQRRRVLLRQKQAHSASAKEELTSSAQKKL